MHGKRGKLGDYWGGVTVNALDGTIIDKDKGY